MTSIIGYNGYMEIRNQQGDLLTAEPLKVINIQISRNEPQYLEDVSGRRLLIPQRNDGSLNLSILGDYNQVLSLSPDMSENPESPLEQRRQITISQNPEAQSHNLFHNAFLQSFSVMPLDNDNLALNLYEIDMSWRYQSEEPVLTVPVELRPENAREFIQEFSVHETIGTNLRGIRADVMIMDEAWDHPHHEVSRRIEKLDWRQLGF